VTSRGAGQMSCSRTGAADLALMASFSECIVPRCTVHGAESIHLWVHPHVEAGDCGLNVDLCFFALLVPINIININLLLLSKILHYTIMKNYNKLRFNWNIVRNSFINPYPILDETRVILVSYLHNILLKDTILLDIGSSTRYIENIAKKHGSKYIAVDYPNWNNNYRDTLATIKNQPPDTWSDIRNIGITDNSVDVITCIDVLEHIDSPKDAFQSMARITKKDGTIILLIPFFMEIHGGNNGEDDYFRYTKSSIEYLFNSNGIELKKSEYIGKFGTTLNTLISGFIIREYQFAPSIQTKLVWLIIAILVIPLILMIRTHIDNIDSTRRNPAYIIAIGKKY